MMIECWTASPDARPSFKQLYTDISKYIGRIAGYLEIGFNPFAGKDESLSKVQTAVEDIAASCGAV